MAQYGAAETAELARWMTGDVPPDGLDAVHADRFGNDMSQDAALQAIRRVYAQGYHLPDSI